MEHVSASAVRPHVVCGPGSSFSPRPAPPHNLSPSLAAARTVPVKGSNNPTFSDSLTIVKTA